MESQAPPSNWRRRETSKTEPVNGRQFLGQDETHDVRSMEPPDMLALGSSPTFMPYHIPCHIHKSHLHLHNSLSRALGARFRESRYCCTYIQRLSDHVSTRRSRTMQCNKVDGWTRLWHAVWSLCFFSQTQLTIPTYYSKGVSCLFFSIARQINYY